MYVGGDGRRFLSWVRSTVGTSSEYSGELTLLTAHWGDTLPQIQRDLMFHWEHCSMPIQLTSPNHNRVCTQGHAHTPTHNFTHYKPGLSHGSDVKQSKFHTSAMSFWVLPLGDMISLYDQYLTMLQLCALYTHVCKHTLLLSRGQLKDNGRLFVKTVQLVMGFWLTAWNQEKHWLGAY